jgi:protein TonB
MRELEEGRSWNTGPVVALLVAGVLAGGGWEIVANMDAQDARDPRMEIIDIAPAGPDIIEIPAARSPVRHAIIPPPPLVEPARVEEKDVSAEPTFTPFTVAPSILNRSEVVAAMEKAYPALLRDAGISGTVRIYFFIGSDGTTLKTQIDRPSPHPELDEAALSVASIYRFSPALNRTQPVPVWVSFPITFQVR